MSAWRVSAAEYRRLVAQLSAVLYDHDPFAMGRTLSAPKDEYDEFAAIILARVRACQSESDLDTVFRDLLPAESTELRRAIKDLLGAYGLELPGD